MAYIYFKELDKILSNDKLSRVQDFQFDEIPHLVSFRPTKNEVFTLTNLDGLICKINIIENDKKNKIIKFSIVEFKSYHKLDFEQFFFKNKSFYEVCIAAPDKVYLEKFIEFCALFPIRKIFITQSAYSAKQSINIERLKKILIRSCEQAERIFMPSLNLINDIKYLNIEDTNIITLHTKEINNMKTSKSCVDNQKKLYLIGPEGGWSEKEIEQFIQWNSSIIKCGEVVYPAWAALLAIEQ